MLTLGHIPTLSGGLTIQSIRAKLSSLPVMVHMAGESCRWAGRTGDEAQPLMTLSTEGEISIPKLLEIES